MKLKLYCQTTLGAGRQRHSHHKMLPSGDPIWSRPESRLKRFVLTNLSSGLAGIPKSPDRSFLLTSSIWSCTEMKRVRKGKRPCVRKFAFFLTHNKKINHCHDFCESYTKWKVKSCKLLPTTFFPKKLMK